MTCPLTILVARRDTAFGGQGGFGEYIDLMRRRCWGRAMVVLESGHYQLPDTVVAL